MAEKEEIVNAESTNDMAELPKRKLKRSQAVMLPMILVLGIIGGLLGAFIYNNTVNFRNMGASSIINTKINVQESSAVITAVNKVKPAVVSITGTTSSFSYFGGTASEVAGTGYIVTKDGVIVTNKHVVSGATNFQVLTNDGKSYSATVEATDPVYDIAILKINASNLPTVSLGSSDSLQVGSSVIAIGNALGQYQNSVTVGVISGVGRTIQASDSSGSSTESLDNVIQTDAAINSGNSGGPLVSLDGTVIGMNTAVDQTAQGIGFAIPVNLVKSALVSYLNGGKIVRPMLGVSYIPITKELASQNNLPVTEGAYIYGNNGANGVVTGSPADKAGLRNGDIITMIGGDKITETNTLVTLINKYMVGDTVKLTYLRDGKTLTANVTLVASS